MTLSEAVLPVSLTAGNIGKMLEPSLPFSNPKAFGDMERSARWQGELPRVLYVWSEKHPVAGDMRDALPCMTVSQGGKEIIVFSFLDLDDLEQNLDVFRAPVIEQLFKETKHLPIVPQNAVFPKKEGRSHPVFVVHTNLKPNNTEDTNLCLLFFLHTCNWLSEENAVFKKALEVPMDLKGPGLEISPKIQSHRGFTQPHPVYTRLQEDPDVTIVAAINAAHTDVIEELLSRGAQATQKHLLQAAKYGRVHATRVLLKREGNFDCLHRAGQLYGYPALVQIASKQKDSYKEKSPDVKSSCDEEYDKTWKEVTEMILNTHDIKNLKEFIATNISFIHYQDEEGLTPLHVAAREGHELGVKELLNHGALPTAKSYDNLTPADLAYSNGYENLAEIIKERSVVEKQRNEKPSQVAKRYVNLLSEISKGAIVSRSDAEDKANRVKQVKEVSSLLAAGTPLELNGSFISSALLLAISTNSRHLLPLLLAAGAPLTATTSGFGPIQLAAVTPGVTIWVNVVVTRAVKNKLKMEMNMCLKECDQSLKSDVDNLLKQLEGNAPWDAMLKSSPQDLPNFFAIASERGATTIAWWVWQAGKNTATMHMATRNVLHAALMTSPPHLDTANMLINRMGCNPFVKYKDELLFDLIPELQQQQLMKDFLLKEYKCLYKKMGKARYHKNLEEVRELEQIVILQIFLYCVSLSQGIISLSHPLFEELLATSDDVGLEGKEEGLHISNEDWIACLIKRFGGQYNEAKISFDQPVETEDQDFWDLCELIMESLRCRPGEIGNELPNISKLYLKALKVCSEKNLLALLYLLVTLTNIDLNKVVDPLCGTRALHLAGMHGHFSIAASLIDFGCSQGARDKTGNTPAHYAFMAGEEEAGILLSKGIEDQVNDCGLTPRDVNNAYLVYTQRESSILENVQTHEQTRYYEADELMDIRLQWLRKKWSEDNLKTVIRETHVDFNQGESLEVKEAISSLTKKLVSRVAEKNKVFEGTLIPVGSTADNTKQFCPDEYDYNLVLTTLDGEPGGGLNLEIKDLSKEGTIEKYIELSVEKDEFRDLFHKSNFVDTFYHTAKACLEDLEPDNERLCFISPGIKKTQVGINLCLVWMGKEFPLMMVDVDVVPTVEAPWPCEHPLPNLKCNINKVYLNNMTANEWRFSFGIAESSVMKSLTDNKRRVFLGCKLILSSLKASWWSPQEVKRQFTFWDKKLFRLPVPAGFVLKNVFFKELEEVTDEAQWGEACLLERMMSIFSKMCEDPEDPHCRMPRKVMAYFGGKTQTPSFAQGAPEILTILKSLKKVGDG